MSLSKPPASTKSIDTTAKATTMPETNVKGESGVKEEGEDAKMDTFVNEENVKDDCSDITDTNKGDGEEEHIPRSFPQKLLDILTDEKNIDIITWLPHGNGFIITKKKTFANEVLPKYFKASKFTSFTRKLNRWGFQRVPRGPECGSYFHRLFRRDQTELCLQMTSNSGNKYQSNPLQQHLLPNVPGGMMPGMPYGFMNMTPQQQQQQQAMWQQQMQHMMQMQQMHMMQMQQQQQRGGAQPYDATAGAEDDVKKEEDDAATVEDVEGDAAKIPSVVKVDDVAPSMVDQV